MIYCLLLSLNLSFSFPRLRPFISSFQKKLLLLLLPNQSKEQKKFFSIPSSFCDSTLLSMLFIAKKKRFFFVLLKIKIWKMLLLLYWIIFISSMCTISDIYISYFLYFSMHFSLYCTNNNTSNGVVIRTNFKRHV